VAEIAQSEVGAKLQLKDTGTGRPSGIVEADAVIACDGINSSVRRTFYPNEPVAFAGINSWRGLTRRKPIFDGRTYLRIGSIRTGKIVIYPIADDIDGEGSQLINWMADIQQDTFEQNDWNKPGDIADFLPVYEGWQFDWLDVAQMIRDADQILEYPMVDKDPVDSWTFGRVTLAGDAAHPMYPRGSNGAAQALIDARTLADILVRSTDVREALKAYEAKRIPETAAVVRTNRQYPPDYINTKVEELVGDRPFEDLNQFVTQDELRALSESYKRTAGFALADVTRPRLS
jgi:2-polyprenyl-6-methoxyphenol hydroxylase-like FAD-dependent oxidoreductase